MRLLKCGGQDVQTKTKVPFNKRAFTALVVLFAFIAMVVTGVILYLKPPHVISREWVSVHIVLSFVLILAGCVHIVFNWKPLVRYFGKTASEGLQSKRELVVAFVVVAFLVCGTAMNLPVLRSIAGGGHEHHMAGGPGGPGGQGEGGPGWQGGGAPRGMR